MRTDFSDILRPDTSLAHVPAPTKKHLFQALAAAAGEAYGLDPRVVTKTLAEREKLGSTGFGGGVAIPPGRVEGHARVVAVVVQLAQPIDYQAIDDLPVDLAFMLLSPPPAGDRQSTSLNSRSSCAYR